MTPTRDLIPPGLSIRRRLWLRAKLRRHRIGVVFSDWRYPASLAALVAATGLVVAIGGNLFATGAVLDRLESRAATTDCTNERSADFDIVVGDILLALDPPPGVVIDPVKLRERLEVATEDMRTRSDTVEEGGCRR